jgi:hypothetical protein
MHKARGEENCGTGDLEWLVERKSRKQKRRNIKERALGLQNAERSC